MEGTNSKKPKLNPIIKNKLKMLQKEERKLRGKNKQKFHENTGVKSDSCIIDKPKMVTSSGCENSVLHF